MGMAKDEEKAVNNNLPLPAELLARTNRQSDEIGRHTGEKRSIWQNLDEFIHEYKEYEFYSDQDGKTFDWPESVFMPFGLYARFIERHFHFPKGSFRLDEPEGRGMAQLLACLAPWRATQDIIKFDPDMEAEIKEMEISGKLPTEILTRLPAWCVYVDVPLHVDGDDFKGFFAQLDIAEIGLCMALTFQTGNREQQRITLALGDMTLEESLSAANKMGEAFNELPVMTDDPGIREALNLVTYICAYGLSDRPDYNVIERKWPKWNKTKKGWRIFPPHKPRTHTLGTSFGEELRKTRLGTASKGWSIRPHVRRPHWHHFWKGRANEKTLIVHWLPPIFVGDQEKFEDKQSTYNE